MTSIACLPDVLHPLFTTTADRLARDTGAIQRQRVVTGSRAFVHGKRAGVGGRRTRLSLG